MKIGRLTLSTLLQCGAQGPSHEADRDRKEEDKPPLLAKNMIPYLEDSMESTRKLFLNLFF